MSNTTSQLNDLIETLKDGQVGFRSAADEVTSPELKALFAEFSLQRSKFAGELQALAIGHGDHDPADSGSAAGAIHRGWMNLKAAITSKDDHAILAECERGEDYAVAAYRKALEDAEVSKDVASTLQRQAADVKAAHDRVRSLRDATAKAA